MPDFLITIASQISARNALAAAGGLADADETRPAADENAARAFAVRAACLLNQKSKIPLPAADGLKPELRTKHSTTRASFPSLPSLPRGEKEERRSEIQRSASPIGRSAAPILPGRLFPPSSGRIRLLFSAGIPSAAVPISAPDPGKTDSGESK